MEANNIFLKPGVVGFMEIYAEGLENRRFLLDVLPAKNIKYYPEKTQSFQDDFTVPFMAVDPEAYTKEISELPLMISRGLTEDQEKRLSSFWWSLRFHAVAEGDRVVDSRVHLFDQVMSAGVGHPTCQAGYNRIDQSVKYSFVSSFAWKTSGKCLDDFLRDLGAEQYIWKSHGFCSEALLEFVWANIFDFAFAYSTTWEGAEEGLSGQSPIFAKLCELAHVYKDGGVLYAG